MRCYLQYFGGFLNRVGKEGGHVAVQLAEEGKRGLRISTQGQENVSFSFTMAFNMRAFGDRAQPFISSMFAASPQPKNARKQLREVFCWRRRVESAPTLSKLSSLGASEYH